MIKWTMGLKEMGSRVQCLVNSAITINSIIWNILTIWETTNTSKRMTVHAAPYIFVSTPPQIQDFPFRRLLWLAGLRWRYSTPPPNGRLQTDYSYIASGRTSWKTRVTCCQESVFTAMLPSTGLSADHIKNTSCKTCSIVWCAYFGRCLKMCLYVTILYIIGDDSWPYCIRA
jgi:hypothetical protein